MTESAELSGNATYSHRQYAPLCAVLYVSAFGCAGLAWWIGNKPELYAVGGVGLLMAVLATAFHHLTVEDKGDVLAIHFGPFPLFHRTVNYADIAEVETGRTLIIDGWGIHYTLFRGWVWNLWGRDCVAVTFRNGSVLRIGTDDAVNLAAFLRTKVHGDE